jgi:hypothetical protein
MSDDAPITSRSGESVSAGASAPPSGRRAFAFVLRDRLADLRIDAIPTVERAVLLVIASYADPSGANAWPSIAGIRRVTGHALSRIVEAVQALAARGWLRCHERRDPKTKARTSTGYTVSLAGELWPESEARAKRRATSKLRPGGKPPSPSGATSFRDLLPRDGEPPFRATEAPFPSGAEPLSARRNGSAHDQPMINPVDQPITAAPRGAPDGSGQALLFHPVDHSEDVPHPPTAAEEPPPKRRRVAKDPAAPKVPTAAERYAAAYVAGFAAEGHTITPPTKSESELIGRVCATHARYTDGSPITGEALERWIRKQARRFVSNVDGSRHAGGYGAFGFRRFCDDNPPDRPRPPGEVPPAPPAPPERPVYTPEQQAMADRFVRMGRGERVPAGVPGG